MRWKQSKYNELKFIYPPGTSPFKAPSDVAGDERGFAGVIGERLRFIFYDSKRHEQKKRDEHQPPREQQFHPKSDTTGSECSIWPLSKRLSSKKGFPCVMREPQVQTARMARTWAWRTWNDRELTRKQQNIMHWKFIGKMIDKVRQKAAVEEKKKDDDLKKKKEVSKKLEDEKPGNLLVSVVRKGHQGRAK